MNIPPRNIRRRRLLIFVPVIVLFVALYIIGYKATALRRQVTNYINSTNYIIKQSNFLGKQFRAALNSNSKSKFLSDSLNNYVDEALSLSQRAEAIEPPADLKLAQSFFVVSLKLRHQGLEKYSRPIISTFSKTQSNEQSNLAQALNDIALSDVAYGYFLQEVRRYLNANNIQVTPSKSTFLPASAAKRIVSSTYNKEKRNSLGDADIYIEDVATIPLRVSYNPDNDIRVLPEADSIDVRIEVGNKGKVEEKDIPVEVSLYNSEKFIKKKEAVLDSVGAGETSKITIKGFQVPAKGINTFKIKAGPLYSEKNTDDNNYTYKFIFRSQE